MLGINYAGFQSSFFLWPDEYIDSIFDLNLLFSNICWSCLFNESHSECSTAITLLIGSFRDVISLMSLKFSKI